MKSIRIYPSGRHQCCLTSHGGSLNHNPIEDFAFSYVHMQTIQVLWTLGYKCWPHYQVTVYFTTQHELQLDKSERATTKDIYTNTLSDDAVFFYFINFTSFEECTTVSYLPNNNCTSQGSCNIFIHFCATVMLLAKIAQALYAVVQINLCNVYGAA